MTLQLTSSAFAEGQSIPAKYTCIGENISPDLAWKGHPEGTKSFALIVDDPDAPMGTWVHWVLYNIPANQSGLQEDLRVTSNDMGQSAMHIGKNSYNAMKYQGPCPPSGIHRYFFKLYALDTVMNLSPGASKETLLQAMNGHILAEAQLMGTFHK